MECRPRDRILRPLAVALAVGPTAHSPARREGGMRDGVPHLPRRSVITRGLAGIAPGFAIFAGRTDSRPAVGPSTRATPRTTELYGRGWYAHSADLKFGELPQAGDRYAVYGDLLDGLEGDKVGDFSSAVFTLTGHGKRSRSTRSTSPPARSSASALASE